MAGRIIGDTLVRANARGTVCGAPSEADSPGLPAATCRVWARAADLSIWFARGLSVVGTLALGRAVRPRVGTTVNGSGRLGALRTPTIWGRKHVIAYSLIIRQDLSP